MMSAVRRSIPFCSLNWRCLRAAASLSRIARFGRRTPPAVPRASFVIAIAVFTRLLAEAQVRQGIQPLTAVTFSDAFNAGQTGRLPDTSPLLIRLQRKPQKGEFLVGPADEGSVRAAIAHGPFTISVATPYVAAAALGEEARRKGAPPPAID